MLRACAGRRSTARGSADRFAWQTTRRPTPSSPDGRQVFHDEPSTTVSKLGLRSKQDRQAVGNMEGMQREDLERMLFFEEAKKQAEADVKKDPANGQALTRWGGSLLELAHFRQGAEAYEMIEQAVEKFQAALKLNPKKHDALWCLGNAFTSQGFLNTDSARAQSFFDQAADCFRKALAEEPTNDVYKKALDMTSKAPQLHAELQKQLQTQQIVQVRAGLPPLPAPHSALRGDRLA
eukprot:jgi/Tetstr1/427015/TSEL_017220.t1